MLNVTPLSVCCEVVELEAHGGHGPSDLLKDELTRSLEELEALLKAKDEVGAYFQVSLISWETGSGLKYIIYMYSVQFYVYLV